MAPAAPQSAARAALLCVLACAFFAGANALAKAAQTALPGPELHPLQVTAARFLFALLAIAPFALARGVGTIRTAIPLRHLQRVLLGLSGVTCMFAGVGVMPLADVISIAWSAPLFAIAFAAIFLKERPGPRRWAAAAVGFVGVVVLMRPTSAAFDAAALLPLAAAALTGAEVVTIRILAQRDSALTTLAINNLIGATLASAAAAFVFVMPSGPQALALVGVGVVMVAGQAIFLKAIALTEASAIAPFYYATIAWAAGMGVVFFDEAPGWNMLAGAGLIAAAGVYVAITPSRR